MKKVGVIGLGIMGKPMTMHLLKKGYQVSVYDLNQEVVNYFSSEGAYPATTPEDIALHSDVLITMLPNTNHVEEVLFGETGAVKGLKKGSVVIDMSSISPIASKQFATKLQQVGIEMLDAPVSGGEPKAISGELSIMVGGKEATFESVKDILCTFGKEVTLVGDNGCGTTAKLANQIMVNVNIAAMSEALVLASKAGINVEKMYEAVRGGLAGSNVLDAKVPLILKRNFVAGGRIDINLKDLTNVMDTAHHLDTPLPLTSHVLEIFHALKADGKAADDHGGVVQYYEKLAHTIVQGGIVHE